MEGSISNALRVAEDCRKENEDGDAKASLRILRPITWTHTTPLERRGTPKRGPVIAVLLTPRGPYGENIFWGTGRIYSAGDAVMTWVADKQYYDYESNSFWAKTKSVGCGRVQCDSGADIIICSYDPPGGERTKMASGWPSSVAVVVVTLSFSQLLAYAQSSPTDYLGPHNATRSAVGMGPLTWTSGSRAGNYKLGHSQRPYGKNIFYGRGHVYTTKGAVKSWVCDHYTQVVWQNTKKIGCGCVQCNSDAHFIVCSYDPPGN
ncbi:unnamed protein product [Spirodela intermedia]|uniref:SCP domain-containing protein n=1 Tax=Spirodela intermedia TaxID=51605 RepID=A0A7I8IJJ1_SPIIN|nr:unnamed protein product [Spirodela intermedia]CAA6657660.1 unnamed protein product [Spirodela intermedia]